jgi:uncharacterized protein YjbI with pentapeptide repeats
MPHAADVRCSYTHGDWHCPFDAESDRNLCIFHLPAEQKKPEDFWRHMANYVLVLTRFRDAPVQVQATSGHPWMQDYEDAHLLSYYSQRRPPGGLCCVGFLFPDMDRKHNFHGFSLASPNFLSAKFTGVAEFQSAKFSGPAIFSMANFAGETAFHGAEFRAEADFTNTTFSTTTHFAEARFGARAHFLEARFGGLVEFIQAEFGADAFFDMTTFSKAATFGNATFKGAPLFRRAKFGGPAEFQDAKFGDEAFFTDAMFSTRADFSSALFSGPVYLSRATIDGLMDFTGASLRNRLLFESSQIGKSAAILLWSLNFVHGTSDISMEKGHEKGRITEPAGQVVFRDIGANMNRVSFLHTDILTDRLLVRFSNVKWETDPRQFIFDAQFASIRRGEWTEESVAQKTGLPERAVMRLPGLYSADRLLADGKASQNRAQHKATQFRTAEPLVKQDTERIAREIRMSHEKYGHYGDAGNYYIAEMDYRRLRAPWTQLLEEPIGSCGRSSFAKLVRRIPTATRSLLYRSALELYRATSLYGERPNRAFWNLIMLVVSSAVFYLFAGFRFHGDIPTRRNLVPDLSQFWATLGDFIHALFFSFTNLVPGWFRGQDIGPASRAAAIVTVIQTTLGISVLTLFLLAIRRRFRR